MAPLSDHLHIRPTRRKRTGNLSPITVRLTAQDREALDYLGRHRAANAGGRVPSYSVLISQSLALAVTAAKTLEVGPAKTDPKGQPKPPAASPVAKREKLRAIVSQYLAEGGRAPSVRDLSHSIGSATQTVRKWLREDFPEAYRETWRTMSEATAEWRHDRTAGVAFAATLPEAPEDPYLN